MVRVKKGLHLFGLQLLTCNHSQLTDLNLLIFLMPTCICWPWQQFSMVTLAPTWPSQIQLVAFFWTRPHSLLTWFCVWLLREWSVTNRNKAVTNSNCAVTNSNWSITNNDISVTNNNIYVTNSNRAQVCNVSSFNCFNELLLVLIQCHAVKD